MITGRGEITLNAWMTLEEKEYEDFLHQELPELTPIESRFVRHHFVSTSKGISRGANRKPRSSPKMRTRIVEVELIADKWEPARPLHFRIDANFPYDVKATEVFNNPQAESEPLRQQIRKL